MDHSQPKALCVARPCIDFTTRVPSMPTGDEKTVAIAHSVSFGGNGATAAFCINKLGGRAELMGPIADDWLGRMLREMANQYGVQLHERGTQETAFSQIMPRDGKRAIIRCRDEVDARDFPILKMDEFFALHLDGHQPDAAIYYAKAARECGILTSLDGGSLRSNTPELLDFIDVAVVSERLCEQMDLNVADMLSMLRSKGCKLGAVTLGERGVHWFENGSDIRHMPAIYVPEHLVIDTNGAGDIFHGAYVYAYLRDPQVHGPRSWTLRGMHPRFQSSIWVTRPVCRLCQTSKRRCVLCLWPLGNKTVRCSKKTSGIPLAWR